MGFDFGGQAKDGEWHESCRFALSDWFINVMYF
jgi:hypothetical protein